MHLFKLFWINKLVFISTIAEIPHISYPFVLHVWPWTTKPVSSCQQYIVWVKMLDFSFMPKTITFTHLADAFIQSDLHCIQVTVFTFYQLLLSLGIEPMILALLAPCSTIWATGKLPIH